MSSRAELRAVPFVLLVLLAGQAQAAPPRLREIVAPAAQRGVENRLVMHGSELTTAEALVLPFKAGQRRESAGAESLVYAIAPAPDTPPGVYPVRVRTADGVSNIRLLLVTDLPVIRGTEPNGRYRNGRLDPSAAQPVEIPAVIAGGRLESDIDSFRFTAAAGQRLVLETFNWRTGLTPEPLLRLWTADGRRIAERHDTPGLHMDERLDFTLPAAGEYCAELQGFRVAGWTNHSLLRIGPAKYARAVFPLGGRRGETIKCEIVDQDGTTTVAESKVPQDPWSDHWHLPLPDLPGSLARRMAAGDLPEVFEQDDRQGPQTLTWPCTLNGRVLKPDEEDLCRLEVAPGEHVRIRLEAYFLGSPLDGHLTVLDPAGQKLLAKSDDQITRGNPDPALSFEVPQDVRAVHLSLRDVTGAGGIEYAYRLTVEKGGADFFLWLGPGQNGHWINEENKGFFRQDANDTLNVPAGGEAKLLISAMRTPTEDDPYYAGPLQGYQGPIQIRAEGVPPGMAIESAIIPAGQKTAEMVCRATADAPREPFEVVIVGEATREDGTVLRHVAERKLFLSHPQFIASAWNWRVQKVTGVVTRPADPAPDRK